MNQLADIQPSPSLPIPSERFRLARLAREASLRVPGVVGTDTGPMGLFITVGGGQRLEGVVCVSAKGGYEVSLRLVCALVPLPPLAEQVTAAVTASAAEAGLPLESVSLHVAAVAAVTEL